MSLDPHVTRWLRDWRDGDDEAIARVTEEMYRDLRRLAAYYLRQESQADTMQPTALVHEAFLHLSSIRGFDWKARGQFVAVIAKMMRRILIDQARQRRALKRTAGNEEPVLPVDLGAPSLDVLIVDQALTALAEQYPRHAKAVELRFFGGLSSPEIGQVLDLSLATVERDWRFAKAWLHDYVTTGKTGP
jgi:RNA polymerase sigma-70 factor (ECF subfamily)